MDRQMFVKAIIEPTFIELVKINETKGREYSGNADALSNFKNVGQRVGIMPTTALLVYMTKHWDSTNTFIKDLELMREKFDDSTLSEPIEGRIDDLILYALLLKGLIVEWRACKQSV